MTKETITTICGICPGGCGVNVLLVDGLVEKITPVKRHPIGVVCVRGTHSKEIIYSRDRLKYPLLRVGEKGKGKFKRITWDDAIDRIVHAFQKTKDEYGPQAVMSYFGRGSFESNILDVFERLIQQVRELQAFCSLLDRPTARVFFDLCHIV